MDEKESAQAPDPRPAQQDVTGDDPGPVDPGEDPGQWTTKGRDPKDIETR
jgi:hypothetical protein